MPTLLDAWPALALMGLLLVLPWGITWLRRKGWQGTHSRGQVLKVVGAVAVGPHQKVVTVEVVCGSERKWLVLGVTPQSITHLDGMKAPTGSEPDIKPTHTAATAHQAPPAADSFQAALAGQRPAP